MTSDIENLHGHESWKWYGFAGHLIVSRNCAYHLNTRVGNYIVSTVGAYYPKGGVDYAQMEPIGSGADDFFETFVFNYSGEEHGNAIVDFEEIDGARYSDSLAAEKGHYEFCWKYHEMATNGA